MKTRRSSPSGPIARRSEMPGKVGSVWILYNPRCKSRRRNSRRRLSKSNPSGFVGRIRSAMRNDFIFKLTLVRFGGESIFVCGETEASPVEDGRSGKSRNFSFSAKCITIMIDGGLSVMR